MVTEIYVTDPTGTSAAARTVYSMYTLLALLVVTVGLWLS
jgi:hypothetical protein